MTNTVDYYADEIAEPFPQPPNVVRRAMDLLQPRSRGGRESETGQHAADLPRPWDPAGCPPPLRKAVWTWCEQVAVWLNHEYCWRPEGMIPACWTAHPHIAQELAALAIGRWAAGQASNPAAIEEWHRYSYPMFCQRMTDRLGESTCRNGRHIAWPGESRHAAYLDALASRADAITADTHAARTPHTTT